MWRLREEPGTVHLMPLSPSYYRAQQPSYVGTIEPEGSGSRVSGRVTPHPLTVGITAFLLLLDALFLFGGVAQQVSRRGAAGALPIAMFGILFGAVAVAMLRLSVSWAAADVRALLETAASSDRAVDFAPCRSTTK